MAGSDSPPPQTLASEPVRPLAWYESVGLQLVMPAVVLVAFAGFLISSVLGRPLLWLLLQAPAVGVITAGVALAVRWRRSGGGIRLGLLLAGGVVFVPWAAYWGLLTA